MEYELWLYASEYRLPYALGFWIGVATVWVSNLHLRIFVILAAVMNDTIHIYDPS